MSKIVFFLLALVAPALAANASAHHLKLRNTYYYVVLEQQYERFPTDTDILGMDGQPIAKVSHAFKKAVDIEGTGRLRDGRVINYAGRKDGMIRYLVTKAHWGYGVAHCLLKPFRSVAVDPRVVRLGSVIYIAETDGMLLPDGTIHDGFWTANDIGSAILRDRIDLFVGDGNQGDVLERAGITNLKALHITVVRGPGADSCVKHADE